MLLQNFGVINKEYYGMLWYFLEWSIEQEQQSVFTHVTSIYANLLEQKKALFNSLRIDLEHQHGRRFIVLEHQYGRCDVM